MIFQLILLAVLWWNLRVDIRWRLNILNEVDILAMFVSMSWFGFGFWFWIFWICACVSDLVLMLKSRFVFLDLCSCVFDLVLMFKFGFVFLGLCFCVFELVLLCSLNGFGLVSLKEMRFYGFVWVCCVCIVGMLCLILNFSGFVFVFVFVFYFYFNYVLYFLS